jgi:hypothetical protein
MMLCGRSHLVVTKAVLATMSSIPEEQRWGVDGELGGQNREEWQNMGDDVGPTKATEL